MTEFERAVEATLFAAAEPMTPEEIAAHAGDGDVGDFFPQHVRKDAGSARDIDQFQ